MIDVDPRLLALFTAFTFGLAPVVIRHAYERGGTTGTGLLLQLLAAVAVNVALLPIVSPRWETLTPAAAVAFVLGGLSGNALGRRWSFVSVQLLGASRSSAIRGVSPLFTALVAAAIDLQHELGGDLVASLSGIAEGLADRERVLEEMFQLAWSDGELDESELRVIRDYARAWAIDPQRLDALLDL